MVTHGETTRAKERAPALGVQAKQQAFKRSGLESITELKYTQAKLRREIAWSENANTK
jgi:hypothetical protein